MKVNKKVVTTAVVTALITFLATNTLRDTLYIKDNAKVMRKLSAIVRVIKDYSIYQPDDDKMADMASTALAYTVEDPYTRYYDKDSYRRYIDATSSSYYGIGITLTSDPESGIVTISECSENGPSIKAGVAAGDVLTGVDDMECSAETVNDVITYIKSAAEGQSVTLHILRGEENLDISVTPETIQNVMVTGQMIGDDIGYIKIDNFESSQDSEARTAYDDFMDRVNSLRNSGMTRMIIDLRDNPGGDLGVVSKIADEFLSDGIITYTEDKKGEKNYIYAQSGSMDYPVVIVTNGSSASASEVLTGALKDNGRATVVGEKTYGKGVVQRTYPLSDGSGITVTIARYFTPSGVCIHGIGIEPDVECSLPQGTTPSDYSLDEDPQIAKAIEVLNTK